MIAALCIDDNRGLRFNRRRQSRDRAVTADLLRSAEGHKLWAAPGSVSLFPEGAVPGSDPPKNRGPGPLPVEPGLSRRRFLGRHPLGGGVAVYLPGGVSRLLP